MPTLSALGGVGALKITSAGETVYLFPSQVRHLLDGHLYAEIVTLAENGDTTPAPGKAVPLNDGETLLFPIDGVTYTTNIKAVRAVLAGGAPVELAEVV